MYTSYTHRSAPPTTIGELPNHINNVLPDTPGKLIAKEMEQNAKLPGVLVLSADQRLVGMVSRQKCFEHLGRPFGVEVFLNRPISALIERLGLQPTVIGNTTRIEKAAEMALQRPPDQLYEPVVVSVGSGEYRLLDLHVLLLAQTELLANANIIIRTLNQELEDKVRERTQALHQAYQQLEQLDKTKSDFITVASSELRAPLMVVNQYSQMLLLSSTIQTSSGLVRMITEMNAAIKRLDGVVETMLDVARVDSQELALNFQPVALDQIFSRLLRDYDKVLQARDLHLTIHFDARNIPPVRGDPDALYKVFDHLLQNAIKFTPNGGYIHLSGKCAASNGHGEDSVEIVMEDSGVGIAPEQLETIFSKFYQTGKVSLHSISKLHFKGGGAGLGLAIVRGIVEACKGKVWAESPGTSEETFPGSSFTIRLPIASPTPVSSIRPPMIQASTINLPA